MIEPLDTTRGKFLGATTLDGRENKEDPADLFASYFRAKVCS